MSHSPYDKLPPHAFWRTAIATSHFSDVSNLYEPKFEITKDSKVVTAGSCFAQHIARQMKQRGFNVLDGEPAPHELPPEVAAKYGFGQYSARYGNIYTCRQLLQLWEDAIAGTIREEAIWEREKRYFDALRPAVEPTGLASRDSVRESRLNHLRAVRETFGSADLVVFTLGLTETWQHTSTGTIFPTAPGTISGSFDQSAVRFKKLTFSECETDFLLFRDQLKKVNRHVKFLLTVSPVPLTATGGGGHVLPASVHSKSVLRALAGELTDSYEDIDYFPSYEIVTSPSSRGALFEPNLRSVSDFGVRMVMESFFDALTFDDGVAVNSESRKAELGSTLPDPACEEALLEAFAP